MSILPNTVYKCNRNHVTMGQSLRHTYFGYECPQCGGEVYEDEGSETGKWLLKFFDIPRDPTSPTQDPK